MSTKDKARVVVFLEKGRVEEKRSCNTNDYKHLFKITQLTEI